MKSQAVFYEKTGPAQDVFKIGFFDIPNPEDHEVQVEIMTSGINPSDVKIRAGSRGNLAFSKIIPHSDGAGIVRCVGKAVKRWKKGDRVWIYNGGWQRDHGTACTLCNFPENILVPLPENTSFEVGACLGIPALTAASCLLSLNCPINGIVMVTGGAGSVGIFAIQLAKFLKYRVITTVSSKEKETIAISAGADYVINYTSEDVLEKIKRYTQNELLDGIIDVDFGSNLSWSIDALKDNKTIATYASVKNPEPKLPFYQMMFKQITIRPIFVYNLEDSLRHNSIQCIQNALSSGVLIPVIHKIYDLEQVAFAHQELESGQKIGQVLLKMVHEKNK